MSLSMLLIAIFSGLVAALLWIFAGGSFLGAAGVYVLTGQLVTAAMVLHLFFGKDD
jgi:hypothetical protein